MRAIGGIAMKKFKTILILVMLLLTWSISALAFQASINPCFEYTYYKELVKNPDYEYQWGYGINFIFKKKDYYLNYQYFWCTSKYKGSYLYTGEKAGFTHDANLWNLIIGLKVLPHVYTFYYHRNWYRNIDCETYRLNFLGLQLKLPVPAMTNNIVKTNYTIEAAYSPKSWSQTEAKPIVFHLNGAYELGATLSMTYNNQHDGSIYFINITYRFMHYNKSDKIYDSTGYWYEPSSNTNEILVQIGVLADL